MKKKKIIYLAPILEEYSGGKFRINDNLKFLRKHFDVEEIYVKSKKDFNSLIEYLKYLRSLKKSLRNNVVFMEFPKYGFLIPFSSKLIYSAHNFETILRFDFFKKSKNMKEFISFIYWSLNEFYTLYRASIIITITSTLKKQLEKFNKNKIVELFPKLKNKIKQNKEFENKYYFLGSFDWKPNYEAYQYFLKELYPYIKKFYNKEIKFYFIGKGNNKYKDIKDENIEIIHLDYIESLDYLSDFKGSIIPILSGSGIKIKLLDSVMYGKIPISTLKGIEGLERYKDYFLLFKDSKEFCECIKYLDDESKFKQYQEKEKDLLEKLIKLRIQQEKEVLKRIKLL